jgi:hypothetical protein
MLAIPSALRMQFEEHLRTNLSNTACTGCTKSGCNIRVRVSVRDALQIFTFEGIVSKKMSLYIFH